LRGSIFFAASACSKARRVVEPKLADDQRLPVELRDLDAFAAREPVILADEQGDRMPTIRNGEQPSILIDMRQHRDIALVVEEVAQNIGRVAKLYGEIDARIRAIEGGQHLGDMVRTDGADRQLAVLELARLFQEGDGFVFFGEKPSRDREELAPRIGQLTPAALLDEKF